MSTVTKMKAPTGVTSATIQDHPYAIPSNGIITVISPNHIEDLKRHGFVEVDDDGEPDFDGMDDSALISYIEERGGETDDNMKRKKLLRLAREAYEESQNEG